GDAGALLPREILKGLVKRVLRNPNVAGCKLAKDEVGTVVVVDEVDALRTCVDGEVPPRRRCLRVCAYTCAQRSRRELEAASKFCADRPPGREPGRLAQLNRAIAPVRARGSAERAAAGGGGI